MKRRMALILLLVGLLPLSLASARPVPPGAGPLATPAPNDPSGGAGGKIEQAILRAVNTHPEYSL
ncbi:MAG: hypothetical protein EHM70_14610, partial [Chloroflexota bacterium]